MRFYKALYSRIARALTIFGLLLHSVTSLAAGRPHVRVLTFLENSPWQAIETILAPEGATHYRTEKIEAVFKMSNKECESLLGKYQERPLKVMLDNKYITKELFDELSDPKRRAHDMRQYVLVTLYEVMTRAEATKAGIGEERFLDKIEGRADSVRVHMGAMYAVRGYDLERGNIEGFKVVPRALPYEAEGLPPPLSRPLDRAHIPMTVEIGRALVEKGGDRSTFSLLMKLVTGVLAADARIMGVAPDSVAVFGRADDAAHARLYAATLGGKPMTPVMQTQLEANPAAAMNNFAAMPAPTKEYWAEYKEGVILGSLAQLLAKFPEDELSATAAALRAKFGPGVHTLQFVRDFQSFMRRDYDLTWYDPHRPGQRAPLRLHDWGTGLLEVRLSRLLKKHGLDARPDRIEGLLQDMKMESLSGAPDFGQGGWIDRSLFVGVPVGYDMQKGDRLPTLTIENLDPQVPKKADYLAQVILAFAAKLEADLKSLSAEEQRLLIDAMNEVRRKRGQPLAAASDLKAFLDTYDFNFGTSDQALATELKILGADMRNGLQIVNPFKGGKVDIKIDPEKLGPQFATFMQEMHKQDPAKLQEHLQNLLAQNAGPLQQRLQDMFIQGLSEIFKPCKVYRFGYAEILEMREEYPQFARVGTLAPSFHRQRIQRMYGAYQ